MFTGFSNQIYKQVIQTICIITCFVDTKIDFTLSLNIFNLIKTDSAAVHSLIMMLVADLQST